MATAKDAKGTAKTRKRSQRRKERIALEAAGKLVDAPDIDEGEALVGIGDFREGAFGEVDGSLEPLVGAPVVYPYYYAFTAGYVDYLEPGAKSVIPGGAGEGFRIEDFAACGMPVELLVSAVPGGNIDGFRAHFHRRSKNCH